MLNALILLLWICSELQFNRFLISECYGSLHDSDREGSGLMGYSVGGLRLHVGQGFGCGYIEQALCAVMQQLLANESLGHWEPYG